ncbi:MAG: hypothetical protein PVF27_07905 [Gemmatimonadales bacterium]|jgi:hypothetical protein
MTRADPFTHTFAALADERFPTIRHEAQVQERDTADRPQFMALSAVQRLLSEIESAEMIERAPDAAAEYLAALYVAYQYWDAGRPSFDLPRSEIETRADAVPAEVPAVPHGACYLRFPERWIWARVTPDEPHEPVDGVYVVRGGRADEITILAVLGLREDRPGFSQVVVTTTAADLLAAFAERRSPPFAPVLEGGLAARLWSVTTTGELLQLVTIGLTIAPLASHGREPHA